MRSVPALASRGPSEKAKPYTLPSCALRISWRTPFDCGDGVVDSVVALSSKDDTQAIRQSPQLSKSA
eukprot:4095847-Amphidinium_carterae.1